MKEKIKKLMKKIKLLISELKKENVFYCIIKILGVFAIILFLYLIWKNFDMILAIVLLLVIFLAEPIADEIRNKKNVNASLLSNVQIVNDLQNLLINTVNPKANALDLVTITNANDVMPINYNVIQNKGTYVSYKFKLMYSKNFNTEQNFQTLRQIFQNLLYAEYFSGKYNTLTTNNYPITPIDVNIDVYHPQSIYIELVISNNQQMQKALQNYLTQNSNNINSQGSKNDDDF